MKPSLLVLTLLTTLAASPLTDARPAPDAVRVAAALEDGASLLGWRAEERDHLWGQRILSRVENPAKLDFQKLLRQTEEHRQLVREGIDPSSARGAALIRKGTRRVVDKAAEVAGQHGHCSVWKAISHTDGRAVADLTQEVSRLL